MNREPTDVGQILRSLDDPDHLWFPAGYDYDLANRRANDLGQVLESDFKCGIYLLTGLGVQDATFGADIGIPAEATATGERLWVRISNHGPLAIYGIDTVRAPNRDADIEAQLHPDDRIHLEAALTEHGYTIVPNDPLREPYDGHNDHWRNSTNPPFTWFVRYFDYT
ncbi:MAG: hypothetical protein GY939_22150 [Actinomycetia bacterium]|nr:hypothetical protein [Actinomycetes bacterium]